MPNLIPQDQQGAAVLEKVVVEGDLSRLSPAERMAYYRSVCESLGLNPITRPFEYVLLQGKLTLYARKDAAEQLRAIRGISVTITDRQRIEDVYIVTARATDKAGRVDESTGAVPIGGLKGADLANAFMKAETKSKRRVTLSIAGLGFLDETELETIKDARPLSEADLSEYRPPTAPAPKSYSAGDTLADMRTTNAGLMTEMQRRGMLPQEPEPEPVEAPAFEIVPTVEELMGLATKKGVFLKKLMQDLLGRDRFDQLTDGDRITLYNEMQDYPDKPAGKR